MTSDADILNGCADGFDAAGYPAQSVYYYGEILVHPDYRGRGIASAFYQQREAHARALGYQTVCFAAIVKPDNDPQRPTDYFYPGPLWQRLGFQAFPKLTMTYDWPTRQSDGSTLTQSHTLAFWIKPLT